MPKKPSAAQKRQAKRKATAALALLDSRAQAELAYAQNLLALAADAREQRGAALRLKQIARMQQAYQMLLVRLDEAA